MIYITGDTHGDFLRFSKKSIKKQEKELTEQDYVIVCGDFGLCWTKNRIFEHNCEVFSRKKYTILWVQGNHENYDALEKFPVTEWNGGNVQYISDNIIHLMRGQVYTIDGRKIFTMGGASSHDKERRKEGFSWWASELPTEEELESARKNLVLAENRVDYIFTHCAGNRMQNIVSPEKERNRLTDFLDSLENISFKEWYFGHYHKDLQADEKHVAIFEKVIQLW